MAAVGDDPAYWIAAHSKAIGGLCALVDYDVWRVGQWFAANRHFHNSDFLDMALAFTTEHAKNRGDRV